MLKAMRELLEVADKAAFSVRGDYARKRQNGFSTVYLFDDASRLEINTHAKTAKAFDRHFGGQRLACVPIRANTTSNRKG